MAFQVPSEIAPPTQMVEPTDTPDGRVMMVDGAIVGMPGVPVALDMETGQAYVADPSTGQFVAVEGAPTFSGNSITPEAMTMMQELSALPDSAKDEFGRGFNAFTVNEAIRDSVMSNMAASPGFNGLEGTPTRAESAAALRGGSPARSQFDDKRGADAADEDVAPNYGGGQGVRGNAFSQLADDAAPVARDSRAIADDAASLRDQAQALSNSWGASSLVSGVTPSQPERDGIATMQDAADRATGLAARSEQTAQRSADIERDARADEMFQGVSDLAAAAASNRDRDSGMAMADRGLSRDGERGKSPDYGDEGQPALTTSTPTFAVSVPAFAPSTVDDEKAEDVTVVDEGMPNAFSSAPKETVSLTEGIAPVKAEDSATPDQQKENTPASQANSPNTQSASPGNAFSTPSAETSSRGPSAVAGYSARSGDMEFENSNAFNAALEGSAFGAANSNAHVDGAWGGGWATDAFSGYNEGGLW